MFNKSNQFNVLSGDGVCAVRWGRLSSGKSEEGERLVYFCNCFDLYFCIRASFSAPQHLTCLCSSNPATSNSRIPLATKSYCCKMSSNSIWSVSTLTDLSLPHYWLAAAGMFRALPNFLTVSPFNAPTLRTGGSPVFYRLFWTQQKKMKWGDSMSSKKVFWFWFWTTKFWQNFLLNCQRW